MIHSHYKLSFLLSVLIFLILGLGVNTLLDAKKTVITPKSKIIKIALLRPIEPVPIIPKKIPKIIPPSPIIEKIVKPKPKKKPIVAKPKKPKPKPKKLKPKPKPKKPKPKKIIKKNQPKKIIQKRVIESIPKPIYHEPSPIVKTQKTPIHKIPIARVVSNNEVEKKAFLHNIRSRIIANKKYPRIALRRHIEGTIKVKFNITKHGQVNNIRFIQGKRIFQKSVRKTLAKTFPVTIPANMHNKLPILDVTVVLHFNIK